MPVKKTSGVEVLELPPIEIRTMTLQIVGDAPLITHAWSEKAKRQMRDKQGGRAANKKEPKDPQADYEAAMYRLEGGGYGFPSVGFKAAAVAAARQVDGISMTYLRSTFHVVGDMARINAEPVMREDMVRVGMGTADIRYRPEYWPWSTELTVRYNARAINHEQLVHLFNIAGFGVGVGEWRPEKSPTGQYGLFHVESVQLTG